MRGRGLKVALFQVSPSQRGLYQRLIGFGLLQLAENFEIGRGVLRLVLRQFTVRRQLCQQWRRNAGLPRSWIDVDQVGQRSRLVEGDIWKRLVRSGHYAMICGARGGDGLDVALRHMAAYAVIGRVSLHSRCKGQLTALVRMATEAFARKVGRRLFA